MKNTTEPRGRNHMKINLIILAVAASTLGATEAVNWISATKEGRSERLIDEMVSGERCPDLQLLRQMGPEAMPPLLKALAKQDSARERAYAFLRSVLPESFGGYL